MPKDSSFYVNGMNDSLNDSLRRLKRYNRHYLRDMGTVIDAEKGLLSRDNLNKFTPKELKEMVLQRIRKEKLTDPLHGGKLPILCKDGKVRYYQPDSWAETMARTRSRALQEEGLHNQMVRSGFDLIQVSIGGSGDPCTNWEGSILSITGKTPGYPTVEEAQNSGEVFHPRCVHSSNPFIITEDENGPKIWGRDDLTPKAAEQIKNAGLTKKGTVRTGFKTLILDTAKKEVVNMLNTKLATTHSQAVKNAADLADNVKFKKSMDLEGINEATFALREANNRIPAGNKLLYLGDKDQLTKTLGKQYGYRMGKDATATYTRWRTVKRETEGIAFRSDAMKDKLVRKSYKESAEIMQRRHGKYNYNKLINNYNLDPKVIKILQKQNMRHWAVSGELGGTKGIMWHEYGHKIYYQHVKKDELRSILRKSYSNGWAYPLGDYAKTNLSEYCAEVFSAYMQGLHHLIDPDVLKWFKKYDTGV